MSRDHDHDHGHDHHHDNHHDHGDAITDDRSKLKVRIEHWIVHNREHQQSLEEWSAKSADMGLADISASLSKSAGLMSRSVAELETALALFS